MYLETPFNRGLAAVEVDGWGFLPCNQKHAIMKLPPEPSTGLAESFSKRLGVKLEIFKI